MRRQHHEHAEKADADRGPAIDAHAFLQHERGERDRDQRPANEIAVTSASGNRASEAKLKNMPASPTSRDRRGRAAAWYGPPSPARA